MDEQTQKELEEILQRLISEVADIEAVFFETQEWPEEEDVG